MISKAHLQAAYCDLVADVVRSAGSASLTVTGCSMLPAILPGDVLTVRRYASDELQPGHIILYSRNGRLTAHRIIQVSGEHLLTRGDCLTEFDMPVRFIEVVGQVVGIRRNGRPVDARHTFWQRFAASILRRSEWCTRLFLHLIADMRQCGVIESTLEC